jgi:GT2 family glycosyltransferase/glycosyltransferase involved in cell wall biosynthesis
VNTLKKIIRKSRRIYSPTYYRYLKRKPELESVYGGLPVSDGSYEGYPDARNEAGLVLTPFGYLAEKGNASLCFSPPLRTSGEGLCKIEISFSSVPDPVIPKVEFLDSTEKVIGAAKTMRITSARTAELLLAIPPETVLVRLVLCEAPSLIAIHDVSIRLVSNHDLARIDLDDGKARHRAIVCFPVIEWEYREQRPQHLLRELAKQGDHICYISTCLHGYGTERISSVPLEERVTKLLLPGNPRLNLYKHTPSYRSIEIGCRAITSFLLERAFEDVVLFVHLPFWLPYALKLKEERGYPIVYDCMDDHSGFENNSIEMLRAEEELKDNSDLLVTSSQKLFDEASKTHSNCVLIRNAGDPEHFTANVPESEKPIGPYERPVIGYFGAIAEWFDVEAIRKAAEAHPDWVFVLIGYHSDEIREALSRENIHFPGEVSYQSLPAYLSVFDVCTIPFKRIPLTEATNPVKLYEYFASGKPVVARALPEIERYGDLAYLYDTPEDFVTKLESALEEDQAAPVRESRKNVAHDETWEKRGLVLKEEIKKIQKKVSIIILSYEAFPYLRECLASILQNTSYENYEVVVVDNASSPEVRDYLRAAAEVCPKIRLIQNEENKGFAAGNNQGLEYAKDSDYFVLLNNDVVVPRGWLERLLYYAGRKELGVIGPVTNCAGNEAKIITSYQSIPEMDGYSWGLRNQYQGEFFDIAVAAMFCVAFRKEVFDKVGYLDESFGIGMFEDDDYAERVRKAGYRVVCVEDVFIHHYGSVSFNQLPKQTYDQIFADNKSKYEKKWGNWIPHTYR